MAFIGCALQASSQFYAARMHAFVVLFPGLQRGNVQSERPVVSQSPRIHLSCSNTCDQLRHFIPSNHFWTLIHDTGIIRSFEFGLIWINIFTSLGPHLWCFQWPKPSATTLVFCGCLRISELGTSAPVHAKTTPC